MRHPRHREPPPVEDKGLEPFDALTELGDEELDRRAEHEGRLAEAEEDDRFARSVNHR